MEGIITKQDLAHESALQMSLLAIDDSCAIDTYDEVFINIMRMDDIEFLERFKAKSGRWLTVISKNKYILT